MRSGMMKVGTAVPKLKVADVNYNVAQIISQIQSNPDCGLLVFPELCVTGYTCADLFGHQALLTAAEDGLARIAEATRSVPGLTAVVGVPVRHRNCLYNCAAFVSQGEIAALVAKVNIPNYSEFYEARWFTSGRDMATEIIPYAGQDVLLGSKILVTDPSTGAVVGTDVCEDLWVPDKPSTAACLAGANIIVNPSASDEVIGKQEYRRTLIKQQSNDCYCAYLYSSAATDESSTDLVFSGHTMIVESGHVLADNVFPVTPCVHTGLIDLETIAYNRAHQNTFVLRGGEDYTEAEVSIQLLGGKNDLTADELLALLRQENYFIPSNPFVPADDAERGRRCRSILQIQANGLATRVRATGLKNLVIGISGGLDSTLALIVCHEARKLVPDIRIIGYTMPNRGNTTSQTYNNALTLMHCLDVDCREVPIESGVKDHLIAIGHGGVYRGEGDTTYENGQARMRTYILMDAANMENGLVVGTGDLSELALGWCTYNGDHMSMYGVNGSVPKTLVQYICRTYAATCGDDALRNVLLDIIDTPISPELTPSNNGVIAQKTEEKIGKYDLNDFFLFYTLRYGFTPEKVLAFAMTAYPQMTKDKMKDALVRFYRRFFQQQFKRSCLPDGPKVGSVSLSPRGDWRMPSDASAALWISLVENA